MVNRSAGTARMFAAMAVMAAYEMGRIANSFRPQERPGKIVVGELVVVNSAGQEMITLTPSTFGGEIAIWAARPGGARSDQPSVRMAVHAPETAMLDLRNGFDEDGERVLATAFGFPANCSVNVVSRDGESQTRMHISRHHPHQGFVAVSSGDVEATAQMVPEKK